MHVAHVLAFVPSLFWHGVFTHTPARVIAAACFVSIVTQFFKTFFPQFVSGKVAMLVNLLTSLTAIFVAMDPANFWTTATLQQVAVVFAAAAGIHSTAKNLFSGVGLAPGDLPQAPAAVNVSSNSAKAGAIPRDMGRSTDVQGVLNSKAATPVRALLMTLVLLGSALSLTGCMHNVKAANPAALPTGAVDQVDAKANLTLQTIHAFLATATSDVQNGKVTLTHDQLVILDNANRAVNVADAAEKAYHNAGGGDASVLNASIAAAQSGFTNVQAALSSGLK